MIKKITAISLATAILLSVSPLNAKTNEKVYATVNGKNITATDVAVALKNQKVNFDALPKESQKQVLQQIVQKSLLSTKALKSSIVNEKFYKDTLKSAIQNMKEELALQIWMQKLSKDIKITKKEIESFYNENKFRFIKPMELKASHILVKTEKEAKDIINKLSSSKSLKSDFTKLAKEKSTGPSGKDGGELGWFALGKMVPEFSDAAKLLDKGSITKNPVKTQFGYHIIYLDDKKDKGTVSLKDASSQIKAAIGQDKFRKALDKIVKEEELKAKIIYK